MATEEKRMASLGADAATWAANDITPIEREICILLNGTESRMKLGDGVSAYSVLQFVSRRLGAEFNADVQTYLDSISVASSAGAADAGKHVLLDSAGQVDSTMLPSAFSVGQLNILGSIDFTALIPSPPGGHQAGDMYINTTVGQFNGSWGFGQDVNLNERPCEVGDLVLYDTNISGFHFIQGRSSFEIVDREHADDTAAGNAGVPIGGLYRLTVSSAVQVRRS